MTKATIQGLWGRKLRTALTALAVVLGVAMVSGTYVLTDTIKKAFDGLYQDSYEGTGAVIAGKEVVKSSASGIATVPDSPLPEVAALPGVASSAGSIYDVSGTTDLAQLIGRHGKKLGTANSPHFGWGFEPDKERFNPLTLTGGKWAAGPDEVVIDNGIAKNEHYKLGDRISVSAEGPTRQFRVMGTAKFGSVDSIGGATFAVFDVPTAQKMLHKTGQLDQIFMAGKSGVSDEELKKQAQPLLPSTAVARTASEQSAQDSQEINDGLKIIQYFMLAFAAIALVVGSFVIFNTLSMTLAQRVRELATLRTLGASRKQVMRSVLLEGFLTGLFASIAGLFCGFPLAKGLHAFFKAVGVDLPTQGTVLETRTIIVSLAIGVGITVLATVSPARKATRIPPIAAVREGATLPQSRIASHPVTAAVVLGLALVAIAIGLFGGLETGAGLVVIALGCILLFVGVGLITRGLVRPLAAAFGAPGERLGGAPGQLARENATRNQARTARTAGALMIGLALVTLVATLGAGLKSTDRNALKDQVRSDYVVTSENGYDPFTSSAGAALEKAPGVAIVSSVRSDQASAFGSDITVTGVDPTTITHVYDYRWDKGSDNVLVTIGSDGAIVRKSFADDHDLKPGDNFTITTPQGKRVSLAVQGIDDPPAEQLDPLLGNITVSTGAFDAHFPRPRNLFTFVDTNDGVNSATTAALDDTLGPFPDTVIRSKSGWVDERAGGIDMILSIFHVLLALSVVVSLFGMVNALALSVFERTREIGMLRAVGLTHRQTPDDPLGGRDHGPDRRGTRHPARGGAGRRDHASAPRDRCDLRAPLVTIVAFAIVAMIAGTLAAVLPARRASRLNVLKALHYE